MWQESDAEQGLCRQPLARSLSGAGRAARHHGYELVSSGGTAIATVISGGTLEVASGGSASGVVFSSGGMLRVDLGGHLSGTISGFHLGDEINLRGLAFSSSSSTLTWKQTPRTRLQELLRRPVVRFRP